MTGPALMAAMEATWPCAALHRVGPWTIREGRGGGQRVSAASAAVACGRGDAAIAVTAMRGLGQAPIFLVAGDEAGGGLDAVLAAEGFVRHDPVILMTAACAGIAAERCGACAQWPPGDEARALWDAGGIGAARRAVMARAAGPKVALIARDGGSASGVAFVALDGDIAVLHALEVTPAQRRRGIGARIMRAAAGWAEAQGAATLALAVTEANGPARALYAGVGLRVAGSYHYRIVARAAG